MERLKRWEDPPPRHRAKDNRRGKVKNNRLFLLFALYAFIVSSHAQNQPYAKGRSFYDAGQFKEAVSEYHLVLDSLLTCCENSEKVVIDSVQVHLGQALYSLAKEYSANGEHEKALERGLEAVKVRHNVLGETHYDYFISLHNLATYYNAVNNQEKAIETGEKVVGLRKIHLPNHPYLALSLYNLAIDYAKTGNYEAAVKAGEEAAGIQRELPDEQSDYDRTLNNLSIDYEKQKNYPKAIEAAIQWSLVRLELYGENSDEYRNALWRLGEYYYYNYEDNQAIEVTKKAAEITERNHGKENEDYATLLSKLALYYSLKYDKVNTIKYGMESLDIRRRIYSDDKKILASSLLEYGKLYINIKKHQEAEQVLKDALVIFHQNFGKNSDEYSFCCFNLSRNYTMWNKKLIEAIEYGEKHISIQKELEGEKLEGEYSMDYAWWLRNLARSYQQIGNYDKALKSSIQASELLKKSHSGSQEYIRNLIDLSIVYSYLKNYEEAITLSTQALEMARAKYGEKHSTYTDALRQLASYYRNSGNIEKGIELLESLLPIYEETTSKMTNSYATVVNNLAEYNYNLGIESIDPGLYYSKAIKAAKEAADIRCELNGENDLYFAYSLLILSTSYALSKEFDNGAKYYKQAKDILTNHIIDNFRDMTSSERESFWNRNQFNFRRLNTFCYESNGNQMWQELAYDGAIFVKGLLLNSEIDLDNLLLESGDQDVINRYNELKMMRNELRLLHSDSPQTQSAAIQSLEKIVAEKERDLVRKSQMYGDYTRNLSMQWQDVRDALNEDEIAIEFVETTNHVYTAMVLKKDSEYPRMIPLFTKTQLDTLKLEGTTLRFKDAFASEAGGSKEFIYSSKTLGEMVWSPLHEYLQGIKHIYFSPSGIFHQIAIEYLPMNDGAVYDKYTLHRLSSTKQLALRKEDYRQPQNGILYGGLNYDTNLSGNLIPGDTSESETDTYIVNALRSSGISATHLPGTKKEVDSIYHTLSDKKMEVSVYTGETGTEESFKSLSGKKIHLLHIATHGFYLTEEQSAHQMQFLTEGFGEAPAEEDKTLSRSGLLLSGANIKLKGQKLPEGADDGILTAREIANLDLRELDLVVLSACQTGLGEVTGEGVFGLQRGLKKAGAQTIIMSLWNVNDKATEIFMSRFYRNMSEGQSKHEAFTNAQNYLKQCEYEVQEVEGAGYLRNRQTVTRKVKFDNPKYWAAFILLD